MRAAYVEVEGVSTRYFYDGEGPDIMLVHGLGTSADFWFRNLDVLSRSFRVYAPDLLGHGFTDAVDLGTRLPQEAALDHLRAFTRVVGLERFSMVGSSYGAYLATLFCLEDPSCLRRLVLMGDGLTINSGEEVARTVGQSFANANSAMADPTVDSCRACLRAIHYTESTVPEEVLLAQVTSYARPEVVPFYLSTVQALADMDLWARFRVADRLGEVTVPILRIEGSNDPRVNQARIEEISRRSPDCTVVMFDKCGHQPYLEHADRFNTVVTEFLSARSE